MSLNKVLNSLEKSWERDDILLKIKNGTDTDKIVNEFLEKNEMQIRELNNLKPVGSGESELLKSMKLIAKTQKGPKEQYPSMGCSIKWFK